MAPVLSVRDLSVVFDTADATLTAVNGVSLDVSAGEVLGLVGESGSGKSVTGLAILGLVDPPGRVAAGTITFEGRNLVGRSEREMRAIRGSRLAMIFQDPMSTLHPVLRIDTQMIEAVRAHEHVSVRAGRERARSALERVGIPSAQERLSAYPHQFSGGMRQRVAIATALLNRPALLVADEPTTALDVTIQAQILAEVQALGRDGGTAIVWITHDLSVVSGLADRVAVMYGGRIVETGPVAEVLERPVHPYTAGLIGSVPSRNRRGVPLAQIRGNAPTLAAIPGGCPFHTRCDRPGPACRTVMPDTRSYGPKHVARCHHPLARPAAAP